MEVLTGYYAPFDENDPEADWGDDILDLPEDDEGPNGAAFGSHALSHQSSSGKQSGASETDSFPDWDEEFGFVAEEVEESSITLDRKKVLSANIPPEVPDHNLPDRFRLLQGKPEINTVPKPTGLFTELFPGEGCRMFSGEVREMETWLGTLISRQNPTVYLDLGVGFAAGYSDTPSLKAVVQRVVHKFQHSRSQHPAGSVPWIDAHVLSSAELGYLSMTWSRRLLVKRSRLPPGLSIPKTLSKTASLVRQSRHPEETLWQLGQEFFSQLASADPPLRDAHSLPAGNPQRMDFLAKRIRVHVMLHFVGKHWLPERESVFSSVIGPALAMYEPHESPLPALLLAEVRAHHRDVACFPAHVARLVEWTDALLRSAEHPLHGYAVECRAHALSSFLFLYSDMSPLTSIHIEGLWEEVEQLQTSDFFDVGTLDSNSDQDQNQNQNHSIFLTEWNPRELLLEIYPQIPLSHIKARAAFALGVNTRETLGQLALAESQIFEALYILAEQCPHHTKGLPALVSELGTNILLHFAEILLISQKYDSSIVAFNVTTSLLRLRCHHSRAVSLLNRMVSISLAKNDTFRVLSFYRDILLEYAVQQKKRQNEVYYLLERIASYCSLTGRYELAENYIQSGIKLLSPQSHDIRFYKLQLNLAQVYLQSYDYDKGLGLLQRLRDSTPVSERPHYLQLLASVYMKRRWTALCDQTLAELASLHQQRPDTPTHPLHHSPSFSAASQLNDDYFEHGATGESGAVMPLDLIAALNSSCSHKYAEALVLINARISSCLKSNLKQLARLFYRRAKILHRALNHIPSRQCTLPLQVLAKPLTVAKTPSDLLQECLASYIASYRHASAAGNDVQVAKSTSRIAETYLDYIFTPVTLLRRSLDQTLQFLYFHPSALHGIPTPAYEIVPIVQLSLGQIENPASLALQIAADSCNVWAILSSYLNMAELRLLQGNPDDGLLYFQECRTLLRILFLDGACVLHTCARPGFLARLLVILSRCVRFLLASPGNLVAEHIYFLDAYTSLQKQLHHDVYSSFLRSSDANCGLSLPSSSAPSPSDAFSSAFSSTLSASENCPVSNALGQRIQELQKQIADDLGANAPPSSTPIHLNTSAKSQAASLLESFDSLTRSPDGSGSNGQTPSREASDKAESCAPSSHHKSPRSAASAPQHASFSARRQRTRYQISETVWSMLRSINNELRSWAAGNQTQRETFQRNQQYLFRCINSIRPHRLQLRRDTDQRFGQAVHGGGSTIGAAAGAAMAAGGGGASSPLTVSTSPPVSPSGERMPRRRAVRPYSTLVSSDASLEDSNNILSLSSLPSTTLLNPTGTTESGATFLSVSDHNVVQRLMYIIYLDGSIVSYTPVSGQRVVIPTLSIFQEAASLPASESPRGSLNGDTSGDTSESSRSGNTGPQTPKPPSLDAELHDLKTIERLPVKVQMLHRPSEQILLTVPPRLTLRQLMRHLCKRDPKGGESETTPRSVTRRVFNTISRTTPSPRVSSKQLVKCISSSREFYPQLYELLASIFPAAKDQLPPCCQEQRATQAAGSSLEDTYFDLAFAVHTEDPNSLSPIEQLDVPLIDCFSSKCVRSNVLEIPPLNLSIFIRLVGHLPRTSALLSSSAVSFDGASSVLTLSSSDIRFLRRLVYPQSRTAAPCPGSPDGMVSTDAGPPAQRDSEEPAVDKSVADLLRSGLNLIVSSKPPKVPSRVDSRSFLHRMFGGLTDFPFASDPIDFESPLTLIVGHLVDIFPWEQLFGEPVSRYSSLSDLLALSYQPKLVSSQPPHFVVVSNSELTKDQQNSQGIRKRQISRAMLHSFSDMARDAARAALPCQVFPFDTPLARPGRKTQSRKYRHIQFIDKASSDFKQMCHKITLHLNEPNVFAVLLFLFSDLVDSSELVYHLLLCRPDYTLVFIPEKHFSFAVSRLNKMMEVYAKHSTRTAHRSRSPMLKKDERYYFLMASLRALQRDHSIPLVIANPPPLS